MLTLKKGVKKEYSPYVQLDYELLDSAAWTAMSYEAQWLYIELKKQFDYNNGGYSHLILPSSKVSWRMTPHTFWKKIAELIKYGFIKKVRHGGLMKQPNIYALSEGWKQKSRQIVDKEGREAIRLGLAKKRTHRDVADNLFDSEKRSESNISAKD